MAIIIIAIVAYSLYRCFCRKAKDFTDEEIKPNNFVARLVIIGDSGTGKTTFVKSITEAYPKWSGPPADGISVTSNKGVDNNNKIQTEKADYIQGSMRISAKD